MVQIVGFLIVAAVAVYIAYPLLRPGGTATGESDENVRDDLLAQRNSLYREIAELDFDHQVGKVNDDDYRSQREEYLDAAALVLRELDGRFADQASRTHPTALIEELEQEIRRLRTGTQE